MDLTLEWDQGQLAFFRSRGLERVLKSTLSKAGGDAIRATKVDSGRVVRSKKNFKVSRVGKALPLSFPGSSREIEDLVWRMDVGGGVTPAIDFPHRQIGRKVTGPRGRQSYSDGGVMVQINTGAAKLFRGAFLATMKSGHTGIFFRTNKRGRLPIAEAYTTRVSDVFENVGMVPAVWARTQAVFSASFGRLLPLELAKAKP